MRIATRVNGLGSSALAKAVERLRERIARDRRPVTYWGAATAVPAVADVNRASGSIDKEGEV